MDNSGKRRSYAVIGTGGIGGYYGMKLAAAGFDVNFLFRSDYDAVLRDGYRLESVDGDVFLPAPRAYRSAEDMPRCDVILVCLKTTANSSLPSILKPLLHKASVVVLIQNGLLVEEELSSALPQARIIGATAFICSSRIAPAHISHTAYGALTLVPYSEGTQEVMAGIAEDMKSAGIKVELKDNYKSVRWRKLVWNIPYNGLSVALGSKTDFLTFNPHSRALVRDLMMEVIAGAAACGVSIPESFADEMIAATEVMVPYKPSMRLDYDAHRPMEIRAMYANPVAEAARHCCPMPKVEALMQLLSAIEEREQTKV